MNFCIDRLEMVIQVVFDHECSSVEFFCATKPETGGLKIGHAILGVNP